MNKQNFLQNVFVLFLIALFGQSIAVAGNPGESGIPFANLQEQINELSARIEALEEAASVFPGQTCPAGQFVIGISAQGNIICSESGDGGGGPLNSPVLISVDGPFDGQGALDAIWDSISDLLSDYQSEQDCIDMGFNDCRAYYDAIFSELGVTELVGYQISATAEPGVGLIFYPDNACSGITLSETIAQFMKDYVNDNGAGPLINDLIISAGITAEDFIDLWTSLLIFGSLSSVPDAGPDGNIIGEIFTPNTAEFISAIGALGVQQSACSNTLNLPLL